MFITFEVEEKFWSYLKKKNVSLISLLLLWVTEENWFENVEVASLIDKGFIA
jgi:hypothetical protein